ncbi:MAG TPA: xanthine dehydrogenase family protein molybdopterin-binding subunit [Myxococcota bacterium]|nr:xanthine dehydrogenase family protein molybdopterin-binding subunit [Myxococcota bacterium]HQK51621.1 xanthine dehydrogenase family protein molybdopterin-binding subunit [Myxococcota bacterium]
MAVTGREKAWRNDAVAKVTGRARYTDDWKVPGMLHAVPVYSEYVHATLRAIGTDEARACPGVVRVITAQDVPGTCRFGQIRRDLRILVDDRIRYFGDVVAIVVARTRAEAIAAAGRVQVEADPLPEVLDPETALREDAPLLHPEYGDNCVVHHKVRRGNHQDPLADADEVIEAEFETQFIEHAYLEPESALAIPRPDGVMEVLGSMQHPFSTRRFVAALLGVPLMDVEVRSVPMGGGFGGKDDTAAVVCARAALAARLTGRPVKMTYQREWSIRESYKRHPYRLRYRLGMGRDGQIRGAEVRILADAGACCSVTPWVTWRSTVQCCGPYRVPHVRADVLGAYTNHVFTGAMRGFGSPQVNFAVEQLIEMAGERLGLDPVEVRERNLLRQGDVTVTGQVLDAHVVSLGEVMRLALEDSDYRAKRARCSFGDPGRRPWYGIGFAISYRGMSLGAEGTDANSAILNVQPDGSVLVEAAVHENGQGCESAMLILAAEELGLPLDRLRYRQPSTSNIPDGGTTVASRATLMGGGAVVLAARDLKARMAEVLAPDLGCEAGEVRFREGSLWAPDGRSLPFQEAARRMYQRQQFPHAFGVFRAPRVTWDEETGQGDAYFTWVYGCQVAEVEVDPDRGQIRLLDLWAVHDCGRAVNPQMLLGQFYGGMAMGSGYALWEQVIHDKGRIQSLNFHRYRIPRATDLPDFHARVVEHPDPLSPSGAKGVGEPTNELAAPAIANAVYAATGRRFTRLPIRLEDGR